MSKINIYKLNEFGKQLLIASCILENGVIDIKGEDWFVSTLNNTGIVDYSNSQKKLLFPKDGQSFFDQLKLNFKSGYLSVEELL